uniref:Uncharacterized protein n=1 Tax=Kwoniella pini CBS 10737 TaxID=1296096 RepID=A0A1B9I8F4_9TREE|nr:uncharacterized protein I206_02543 [Kwoniella pini CBS 10737]OCF51827.1 hypothetical protein I206_02543 [Kwoniella pini CBS 10737]
MQYYNNPMMGGGGGGMMDPRMQQQQQQMQGMNGMNPMGMGMGGMPGMNGMPGMPGMPGMGNYGQAYRQLGYDYTLPISGYKPEAGWGAWDLATAQYDGGRLERSFFDNIVRILREYQFLKNKYKTQQGKEGSYEIDPNFPDKQISTLTNFFASRHLSEESARQAHYRVYHKLDGVDAGNKTLGGAAAYQSYLIWDRDHYTAFHSMPSQENRERLVGLAVAELFNIWDKVQPRSSRANIEEAAQYAAATAKHLYDRHYDLSHNHSHRRGGSRYYGYGADNDSDSDDDRRGRRRSFYGTEQPYGMGGMQNPMMQGPMQGGMMNGGPMMGHTGLGMPGMGMAQPGMGALGMPGAMSGGGGMMNPMMMNQMAMNGGMNPGMMQPGMMGGMGNMGMMGGGPLGGMPGNHGQMGEAQAGPGMHPYTYHSQSGVAYNNQPIDQMGNPTFPGGPGRSWYGYGQQRYF